MGMLPPEQCRLAREDAHAPWAFAGFWREGERPVSLHVLAASEASRKGTLTRCGEHANKVYWDTALQGGSRRAEVSSH